VLCYSPTAFTSVPEEPTPGVPASFELAQNFPNPFNPSTTIRYSMPERGTAKSGTDYGALGATWVKLGVYDVLGREVAVLVNEKKEPGIYEVSWKGAGMASGVYFYRMQSDGLVQTKKMVLMK
jgi:hypothetical protein